MNKYHFLTEAELDKAQKSLLSQLSDEDLEAIVSELDEAPLSNDQMRAGRFAFDPLKRTTPAPAPKPKAEPKAEPVKQPAPKPKAEPKPQSKPQRQEPIKQQSKTQEPKAKSEPARQAEIKQTVDTLKPKEKSALVKAAKAELKQRETKPKEVKPAQPGTLKKVVKNLALAALAATVIGGVFGGGDNAPSGADSSTSVQQVQQANLVDIYGDSVDQKYLKNPWGDVLQNHKWVDVHDTLSDEVRTKVRVVDTKPFPGNNKLTVILYQTARGVVPLTSGGNKGKYATAKPEVYNTIKIVDIKNNKLHIYKADQLPNYSEFSYEQTKSAFDSIDKNLSIVDTSSISSSQPLSAAIADIKTPDNQIDSLNQQNKDNLVQMNKRIESVMSGRSAWDGSWRPTENYLKQNLKDPDSYKHVNTGFKHEQDKSIITTIYRAKNSFGGYVQGYITVEVDNNLNRKIVDQGNL